MRIFYIIASKNVFYLFILLARQTERHHILLNKFPRKLHLPVTDFAQTAF